MQSEIEERDSYKRKMLLEPAVHSAPKGIMTSIQESQPIGKSQKDADQSRFADQLDEENRPLLGSNSLVDLE
jgi:hypothetical protein